MINKSNRQNAIQYLVKSDLIKLIAICSLSYVIIHFIRITFLIGGKDIQDFQQNFWQWISLGADWPITLKKVWVLFTHMFMDSSFLRLLANMIWLWVFGSVLEDLKGSYRVIPIFITGGFLGAIALITYSQFQATPLSANFTGSQAAIWAVMGATITYRPQYRFWMIIEKGIPIWVMASIFVLLQLLQIGFTHVGMLIYFAAGLLPGLLYTSVLNGYFDAFTGFLKGIAGYAGNNANFLTKEVRTKKSTAPFKVIHTQQAAIDRILEKIHAEGIDALNNQEKKILEEYSRQS
jgi:membrane associated rhomboid family serine protease